MTELVSVATLDSLESESRQALTRATARSMRMRDVKVTGITRAKRAKMKGFWTSVPHRSPKPLLYYQLQFLNPWRSGKAGPVLPAFGAARLWRLLPAVVHASEMHPKDYPVPSDTPGVAVGNMLQCPLSGTG